MFCSRKMSDPHNDFFHFKNAMFFFFNPLKTIEHFSFSKNVTANDGHPHFIFNNWFYKMLNSKKEERLHVFLSSVSSRITQYI